MKKLFVFLIVISASVMIIGCGTEKQSTNVSAEEKDYEKIIPSNNQLAFDLLPLLPEQQENTIVSPMSIFLALSMVYNGAEDVTKEEMMEVLHVEGINVEQLNKATMSLLKELSLRTSDEVQLHVGNSIWLNENFHFQKDFTNNATKYFQTTIEDVNMLELDSPKRMNDWVKKTTNGKIERVIDGPLNPNVVALILNTVYFNGIWTNEFDASKTKDNSFYLIDGQTKEVPFMELDAKLPYTENEYFQIVSLSYSGEKMSMNILLPKGEMTLEQIEEVFTIDSWKQWKRNLVKKEGMLVLPKFQIEYEVDLNEMFQHLGMTTAFNEKANFEKMVEEEESIWISQILHKTYLDVNEKGVEAAAVTSVEMETTSAPIETPFMMNVNRPFFTIITDDESGAILFIGSISNPSVN